KGKFAVLQQDAAPNMVVRACVYGVTIAKIKVSSNSENGNKDAKKEKYKMIKNCIYSVECFFPASLLNK
ncbi:MAG: hypothetical protein LBU34_01000, partial [Planctomycetaceae bacterium]|nr:hypothetical protein [Planctomycetaceae bacterium]